MVLAHLPYRFARQVLIWFGLVLAASGASPLLAGDSLTMVCTAQGMVLVQVDNQTTTSPAGPSLNCPVCLPFVHAPPPPATVSLASHAIQATGAISEPLPLPSSYSTAPPLPSRGPPHA